MRAFFERSDGRERRLSGWQSLLAKLEEARHGVGEAEEGSEARARCERDVRRYEAFLSVLSE